MATQEYTIDQAVEYRRDGKWHHGHIRGIELDDPYPLIFVDVGTADYRSRIVGVEPAKIRPAVAECSSGVSCDHALSRRRTG